MGAILQNMGKGLLLLAVVTLIVPYSFAGTLQGKKVLWVDSYNPDYIWARGMKKGVLSVLENTGVTLEIFHMDTRNNNTVDYKKQAGERAKEIFDAFKPDIVIATDDNAQEYFVVPFLKDLDFPVVFGGVNWSATEYGYPTNDITGIIERTDIEDLVYHLRKMIEGADQMTDIKVGYLSGDVESDRKSRENMEEIGGVKFAGTRYAKTMEELKRDYIDLQNSMDILIFINNSGIENFDPAEMKRIAEEYTKIPSGSENHWMKDYVVLIYEKRPEEQGEWAAQTAVDILKGKNPSDIPIAKNIQGDLTLNVKLAALSNIEVPVSLLELVGEFVE